MKEVYCEICGDIIENGYETNSSNSLICDFCARELKEEEDYEDND